MIFAAPLAVQEAPPDPAQVQVTFIRFVENVSATVALVTAFGPAGFETTIVYCTEIFAS